MRKKGQSLFDKMMENELFEKRYEEDKRIFEIEYQLAVIMENLGITQKDLADKLGIDKSVVSKDFSGALKNAGMKKLNAIAEALDCEFIPIFIPKSKKEKLEKKLNHVLLEAKRA